MRGERGTDVRRPPYGNRVLRGIYLIWHKTKANIDHGYVPHWWTTQDLNDARRAVKWLGDFFDWAIWKKDQNKKEGEDV